MKEYTVRVYGGKTEWWMNDQVHREDGPAIEWDDGSKFWLMYGLRHRQDGPTIEWADGSKEWWCKGRLHREDGPAVEHADGSKFWYRNGLRHREDGAAVEYEDGPKAWFLEGEEMTEEEHAERMKKPKPDPIVKAVRDKFLSRSEAGQRKYHAMLDRDDLSREQWLVHLQEELMDAVNYIEVLLQRKGNDPQP